MLNVLANKQNLYQLFNRRINQDSLKRFIAFTRGEVVDLAKLNKTLDKLEKFKNIK